MSLSCQHRTWAGAWTHEPQDHDLSRSWMLNRLSHPGAPTVISSISTATSPPLSDIPSNCATWTGGPTGTPRTDSTSGHGRVAPVQMPSCLFQNGQAEQRVRARTHTHTHTHTILLNSKTDLKHIYGVNRLWEFFVIKLICKGFKMLTNDQWDFHNWFKKFIRYAVWLSY